MLLHAGRADTPQDVQLFGREFLAFLGAVQASLAIRRGELAEILQLLTYGLLARFGKILKGFIPATELGLHSGGQLLELLQALLDLQAAIGGKLAERTLPFLRRHFQKALQSGPGGPFLLDLGQRFGFLLGLLAGLLFENPLFRFRILRGGRAHVNPQHRQRENRVSESVHFLVPIRRGCTQRGQEFQICQRLFHLHNFRIHSRRFHRDRSGRYVHHQHHCEQSARDR